MHKRRMRMDCIDAPACPVARLDHRNPVPIFSTYPGSHQTTSTGTDNNYFFHADLPFSVRQFLGLPLAMSDAIAYRSSISIIPSSAIVKGFGRVL